MSNAVSSIFSSKKSDLQLLESRLNEFQRAQDDYNIQMTKKVYEQHLDLQHLQSEFDKLANQVNEFRDQMEKEKLRMVAVESFAHSLEQNQKRLEKKLSQIQSEQNNFNTEVVERGTQLKERYESFEKYQISVNSESKEETADIKEKLAETSTGVNVLKIETDNLKQEQGRISSELLRFVSRIENTQAYQNRFNNDIIDKSARLEMQQKISNDQRGSIYVPSKLVNGWEDSTSRSKHMINRMENAGEASKDLANCNLDKAQLELNEKQYQKLADKVQHLERIIQDYRDEQRQADKLLIEQLSAMEGRSNTTKHQMEASKDLANRHLDLELTEKVQLLERTIQDYRDEQRQSDKLQPIIGQLSAMEGRSKMTEHQLENLQAGLDRVNEKCNKSKVQISTIERVLNIKT